MLVRALLASFAIGVLPVYSLEPFWRAKPKYYERVQAGEVLVAVKSIEPKKPEHTAAISVSGGGQVKAPAAFVFAAALDFDRVAKLSGYIDKASFNAEKSLLTLDLSAYGYKSQMDFLLRLNRDTEPKSIGYEVVRGPMRGFQGEFTFRPLSANRSEIGMTGDYSYERFPVPKFFLEFGLQVVFQRMALRLRKNVESEFAKKGPL